MIFFFSFHSYLQRWFACLSPFLEPQNLKDTTEEFQRNLFLAQKEFQHNLFVAQEEFQRNLSVAQDYKPKLQDMVIFNTTGYCQFYSQNTSSAEPF